MSLSMDTRLKIAEIFGVKKSGNTHVADDQVVDDGFLAEDLLVITIEALQNHLNSQETDFYKLFNVLVLKIENPNQMHEQEKSGEESVPETTEGTEVEAANISGDEATTERVEDAEQSEAADLPDAPEELDIDSGREEVPGVHVSSDIVSPADNADENAG